MLNLFKKIRHFSNREQFIEYFFNKNEHSWMKQNRYILAHFQDFFEYIPLKIINQLFSEKEIILIPSSGKYSCSVRSATEVIIVFPELMNLLQAPFDGYAKAILAHELGHVFFDHQSKLIDPMEAQVEADHFAIIHGFVNELTDFLEDQPESIEKRLRLTYCTAHIYSEA